MMNFDAAPLITTRRSTSPWRAVMLAGVFAVGGLVQAQTNALSFDGVDDRVDCGSDASVDITGTAFTMEAWIYPTSWQTNTYQGDIINKESSSGGGVYTLRTGAGGKLNANIHVGADIETPTAVLTLDTWQHVAFTYDGDSARFFVNGLQVYAVARTGAMISSSGVPLSIGNSFNYPDRGFPGKIDEVRLWNIPRTASQILAHMNTAYCGTENGLVAYYRFDQGTAGGANPTNTTLTDLTGYANDGTLTNFALDGATSNWEDGVTGIADCVPVLCPSPIGVAITNATFTGFDLSWTDNGATGYEYEIRTSGDPGSGATGLAASDSPTSGTPAIPVTGLAANMTYYAYVRAACEGSLFSEWSFATVTTPCGPATIPYTENFNSVSTPSIPTCMSILAVSGNPWTTVSSPGYGFTSNCARYQYNSSQAANSWLFTQGLNLTGGTSYRLNYSYGSAGFPEKMNVAYGTAATAGAMTNALADHSSITTSPLSNVVDFTPATDGVYYIGFHAYSAADEFWLFLDDIAVTETPACEAPTALTTSSVSSTAATLTWTASPSNPANGYIWEVRTSGAAGSGATGLIEAGTTAAGVTSASTTVALTSTTAYQAYVRGDCGGGDSSAWTAALNFTTPPECGDTYYDTGGPSGQYTNDADNVTTICPDSPTDQVHATFSAFNTEASWDKLFVFNGNSTTAPKIASTNGAGNGPTQYGTGGWWGDLSSNLPGPFVGTSPNGCLTFAFVSDGGGVRDGWAAAITCVPAPTCFPPSNVMVGNVTSTGAELTWTDTTSAAYHYEVRTSGAPGSGPTGLVLSGDEATGTSPIPLGPLVGGTAYTVYVQGACSGGSDLSTWTTGVSFIAGSSQIGSGTGTDGHLPIYTFYGYNYSQEIYLASEYMGQPYITKIRFKPVSNIGTTGNYAAWTVYMGNTIKTSFTSTTDWVPLENMSQVFTGTVSPVAGQGMELTLDQGFIWDGTSNIVVAVDENTPGDSGFPGVSWQSFPATDRGILYYNDGTNPDPASPPEANDQYSTIAQVQFQSGPVPDCIAPHATATVQPDCDNGQYFISVELTNLGDAPSVNIESDYAGDPGGVTAIDTLNGTYVLGPFPSQTPVNVTVTHNGNSTCDLVIPLTYDCADFGKNALSFDGVDDRVDCGNSTSLNLTGNAVTLEAWIYPTAWKAQSFQGNIINKEQDSNNSGYMLRCGDNGTLNFNVGGEGDWHEISSSAGTLSLNTWQHVAGVYDGDSLHIYVNGVQVASALSSFDVGTSTNPLVIGDWADGTGRNFPGKIDEARVWNTSLSAAAIQAHMDTAYCGNETGLLAYYKFDQGIANGANPTETTLNDLTGYANNGTLTGFTLDGTTSNWVPGVTDMGDCVPVACPTPTLVSLTNATANGFDLSWTDNTATQYEYEVRTSGDPGSGPVGLIIAGSATSGSPAINIGGIDANTTYFAYVRAACGDGLFSDWASATIHTAYCTAIGTSTIWYIDNFVTTGGSANIDNSGSGISTDGYGDFSAMSVSTYAGGFFYFTADYVGNTFHTRIWVDWNNDFDFDDAGELAYDNISSYVSTATGSITIPAGTPEGNYRMRIRQGELGTPAPCGSSTQGEAEDYTITVGPTPDCLFPAGLVAAATSTTEGMANWEASSTVPAGGYDVYYSTDPTLPDDATIPNFVAVPDTFQALTGLPQGVTIHVWVRSHCTDTDMSDWSIPASFISNDDCIGAISCTVNPDQDCGTVTHGMVGGATASGLTTTCSGASDDDVWFSFVATGTTQLVSLINSSGSATDLYHALWSGADCSSLSLVPGSCSDGNSSSYSGLVIGQTYYVQVYTYTGVPGQNTQFDVCIGTPPPPPANDDCIGAYPVEVNPYNYDCLTPTAGTVVGATDSGVTSTCGGTADDDVWFSFVATSTEHRISLSNITGSTSDMYMALWTGDCGDLTIFPGSCSDPQTLNITGLTVGTTYYLQVYTWTSTAGQTSVFDVCIGTPPTCFAPENITLDSFVAPDASISWDDNGAIGFDYEVRTSGAPGSGATGLVQSGNVAASPLSLTDLNDTDVYSVYIRSNCSDVNISSWSDPVLLYTGYCPTLNYTNNVEPICNVTFADIDNDSPSEVNGTPQIEDFTSIIGHVTQGATYTFSVTGNTDGSYTTHVTAFFDWDGNGDWETVVPIGTIVNDDCTIPTTADVTVPVDASVGTSRMRVVKVFNVSPLDPCATYGFGQAEDYTLEVAAQVLDCEGVVDGPAMPGTACIAPPNGYGGVWSAECVCVENVGVGEIAGTTGFAIYPNPASTTLYIAPPNDAPVHVKVYDMVGNLVMEKDMVHQLDITALATGPYTLVATDAKGGQEAHARFMKQ